MYTAEAVGAPIVTQGNTFEELRDNIRQAVELYFEGEDPRDLGFGATPSILTSLEIPLALHGARA